MQIGFSTGWAKWKQSSVVLRTCQVSLLLGGIFYKMTIELDFWLCCREFNVSQKKKKQFEMIWPCSDEL